MLVVVRMVAATAVGWLVGLFGAGVGVTGPNFFNLELIMIFNKAFHSVGSDVHLPRRYQSTDRTFGVHALFMASFRYRGAIFSIRILYLYRRVQPRENKGGSPWSIRNGAYLARTLPPSIRAINLISTLGGESR